MTEAKQFQLYWSRWLFLATVVLLNMICTMNMVSFSPVATLVTQYYGVSGDEIDIIALTPWSINVLGMVVAIYCIGRFKLLNSLRYSATITLIGGLIRALSTAFDFGGLVSPKSQFWITFAGQLVISLGHPIATTMSTKTSQVWFGEHERAISTPILGLAPVLGGMVGQALAPLIMNHNPENLPLLNAVMASPLVLTAISSWFLLKRAEPPTPPSKSAEKLLSEDHPRFREICTNVWAILRNPTILTIILCQGTGSGLINTLLTQLNQMMCSRNYAIEDSTTTALINIIVGFAGAFSLNFAAKKVGLQTEFAKVGFGLASISTIVMMMGLNKYETLWWIAMGFGGFGFFGYAAFPISLELAVEESYPLDASLSEALVHIASQSAAIALVLIGNVMYYNLDPDLPQTCTSSLGDSSSIGVVPRDYTPYYYLIMAMATAMPIAFVAFVRPAMKRSSEDHKEI